MAEFNGRIGHVTGIESPWGNAGGIVKKWGELVAMAETGVGWEEGGSYTLEKRWGNAVDPEHLELGDVHKVYNHDPATGISTNSLSMPNHGLDEELRQLSDKNDFAEKHRSIYVLNVAPVTDDPVTESVELVSRAYAAGARAVLLNAGCPNVITEDGTNHEILSLNHHMFARVMEALVPVTEQYLPVYVRLSPQDSYHAMLAICSVLRATRSASAVFTPNTWLMDIPIDQKTGRPVIDVPVKKAGRSGPAMADQAALQTLWAVQALKGSGIDVVRSSGIMNARELQRSLDIGAVAGAGTTFYYESGDWKGDTDRLLSDLAA